MKRKFYTSTHVAGFEYHDGLLCYDNLKVGTALSIKRDKDNPYDPDAVALYYTPCPRDSFDEEEEKEYLIGYIPREENKLFALLLDLGWKDIFVAVINRISPEKHPEHQIGITIYATEARRKKVESIAF